MIFDNTITRGHQGACLFEEDRMFANEDPTSTVILWGCALTGTAVSRQRSTATVRATAGAPAVSTETSIN